MKVRNMVAASVMAVGLAVGIASPAMAAPTVNVKGMTEASAVKTLKAAGVSVRVATRNGGGNAQTCTVHHQMNFSGDTKTEYKEKKVKGEIVLVPYEVVIPPHTILGVTC